MGRRVVRDGLVNTSLCDSCWWAFASLSPPSGLPCRSGRGLSQENESIAV